MSVHGEEVGTSRIAASHDEVGADVTLVAKEMLLEQGHDGDDAGLAAGGERVQFEVGGDDGSRELGVGGSSCSCAPDLRSDVVQLLAVLRIWKSVTCLGMK